MLANLQGDMKSCLINALVQQGMHLLEVGGREVGREDSVKDGVSVSRVSHPCSGSDVQNMEPADTLSHWFGAGMPEHTGAKGTKAVGMRLISYHSKPKGPLPPRGQKKGAGRGGYTRGSIPLCSHTYHSHLS